MNRVAFIQNRLQFGGRFQVALHMIHALNQQGIVPDFLCFSSRFSPQDARDKYGLDVQFNIKKVSYNFKVPFEWNILLFNAVIGRYVKDYQLVINHNNTSFLYKSAVPTLSYVHYPRKDRMRRKEQSIHFAGKKRSFFDVAHDAFKLAHYAYAFDHTLLPNDFQIANSHFTRQALLAAYPSTKQEVPVLYPPVELAPTQQAQKDADLVVSLGRFSPDKRQLEQIEIAAGVPNMKFVLMGFINSKPYYEQCQDAINRLGLKNVTLMGDASKAVVNATLAKATYFIHNLRNEPFGITAVQGIQAGCLPLVHDSGGQREVVPIENLRYKNADEAAEKLRELYKLPAADRMQMITQLKAGCKRFEVEAFTQSFKDLIAPYL